MTNTNKKIIKISKLKYLYFILVFSVLVTSGTYAFKQMSASNSATTGTAGCFNVNYTGENITTANLSTTTNYLEGSVTTVTLSKNSSCKLYTEANIYLKTNNTTTAPIGSTQALKYKVFNATSQISEGTITNTNDYLLATVPLTDTSTIYTVYLYIDADLSLGYFDGTTYSGYVYATSNQTSTIEGNYIVNFDTNNGETSNLSKTVTNGQTYGWLPTPSKTGYTFTGWKLSSTNITSSTTVTQTQNHTLVAQWEIATYTVRFDGNGATPSFTSKQVNYGSTYGNLPTVSKPGYTFKGWSLMPYGYKQIEYIQSNGTQYIDTNYYWKNENIEINFDGTVITNSSAQSLFGNEEYTSSSGSNRNFAGIPHGSNGNYSIYLGSTSQESISAPVGTRFKLDIKTTQNKTISVYKDNSLAFTKTYDGSVQTKKTAYLASNTSTTVGNIFIFSNHNTNRGSNNNAIQNISEMRLYSFKMHDAFSIVRNFLPCYNTNTSKYGLYDLANDKFYPNAATSGNDFTGGSNVYTTSSTVVELEKNHTLTAIWE